MVQQEGSDETPVLDTFGHLHRDHESISLRPIPCASRVPGVLRAVNREQDGSHSQNSLGETSSNQGLPSQRVCLMLEVRPHSSSRGKNIHGESTSRA